MLYPTINGGCNQWFLLSMYPPAHPHLKTIYPCLYSTLTYICFKSLIDLFLSSFKSSHFLPEFITHLPVTWWKSCLSMSPSRELAPILNKLGCVQSSPSSSFIKESHVKASLALRIPPAGLKPTLWPVCWNEKQNHNLLFSWTESQ